MPRSVVAIGRLRRNRRRHPPPKPGPKPLHTSSAAAYRPLPPPEPESEPPHRRRHPLSSPKPKPLLVACYHRRPLSGHRRRRHPLLGRRLLRPFDASTLHVSSIRIGVHAATCTHHPPNFIPLAPACVLAPYLL
ncbi:hypothetical protein GUJ93_ZPchr0010g8531 [Zizania palustris]|uniref:Uncharacterized protein n=1 Tax=Zizania palustris TaxID=103762 RepID=A0A8J5WHQ9_ZIZPA|nr:hypothetical protein GUJ93_ZPchr0010g8531 [Zizania palustris]